MINDRALVPNASACLLVDGRSDDPNRDLNSKYPQLSWVRRINDNLQITTGWFTWQEPSGVLRHSIWSILSKQWRGGRSREGPPRAPPERRTLKWVSFTSAVAKESGSTFNRRRQNARHARMCSHNSHHGL